MSKLKFLALGLVSIMLLTGCQAAATASLEYPNLNDSRIIPYQHIKHDTSEEYGAVILFEYKMDNYTKYQVSFLSCSCRSASANYQHLMYVEINNNNNSAEEATIRNIEFHYWGDSEVNPENGLTYEMFEEEFLPYLMYKSKAEIDGMTTLRDLKDAGQVERNGAQYDLVDAYSGATVSVDNTISMLHALFDYHVEKYY